mgnify:CR=1 FL=1
MPKFISATPFFLARDLPATLAFYKHLGFHCRHQDHEYAIIVRDAIEIHFGVKADLRDEDATLCRVRVEGIDDLYADYRARGVVHPNGALERKPWGSQEFSIVDPNNFLITFYE